MIYIFRVSDLRITSAIDIKKEVSELFKITTRSLVDLSCVYTPVCKSSILLSSLLITLSEI